MKKIAAWVKTHKWISAAIGAVIGLLFFFLFFRRSSSSQPVGAILSGSNYGGTLGSSGGGGGGDSGGGGAIDESGLWTTSINDLKQRLALAKTESDAQAAAYQQSLSNMQSQNQASLSAMQAQNQSIIQTLTSKISELTAQAAAWAKSVVTPTYSEPTTKMSAPPPTTSSSSYSSPAPSVSSSPPPLPKATSAAATSIIDAARSAIDQVQTTWQAATNNLDRSAAHNAAVNVRNSVQSQLSNNSNYTMSWVDSGSGYNNLKVVDKTTGKTVVL